jgi:hypothetical protein
MSTQVNIAPLSCSISNISVFGPGPNPDDIVRKGESFNLRVTVNFGGPGAIPLMPLNLPIKVTYYAESYGPGNEIELGEANVTTSGGVTSYDLTATVSAATSNLLSAERVYKIAAVLRVGSISFPALVNGFSEGLAMQVYAP